MFYLHKFEWAGKNLTIRREYFQLFLCLLLSDSAWSNQNSPEGSKNNGWNGERDDRRPTIFTFFSMRRLGKCHRSYLLQGTYWYFYFAWYYWNWRWKKYMIEIIDFQFLPHDQVNVEPTPQIKSSVSTFSFWVTDTADYIINKGLPSHPLSSSISR